MSEEIHKIINLVDPEKGITGTTMRDFFVDVVCDLMNDDDYEIPASKVWCRWMHAQKRRDFLKGAITVLRAQGLTVEESKRLAKEAYTKNQERNKK